MSQANKFRVLYADDFADVWALDPIDGTKGFLRGGQYAVCLALLEDGKPVLGVMGTPNLPLDYKNPGEKGVLFVTSKGKGAFQVCLGPTPFYRSLR